MIVYVVFGYILKRPAYYVILSVWLCGATIRASFGVEILSTDFFNVCPSHEIQIQIRKTHMGLSDLS